MAEIQARQHYSLEGLLFGADDSESWLLHGLSQPDKLRDCRPRPSSVTSGRARDDSCPLLGNSILLRTAHRSESARSVNTAEKEKTKYVYALHQLLGIKKRLAAQKQPLHSTDTLIPSKLCHRINLQAGKPDCTRPLQMPCSDM